jgi:hypothetical protein
LSVNGHGSGFFDEYMNWTYDNEKEKQQVKDTCDKLQEICRGMKEFNVLGNDVDEEKLSIAIM